MNEKTQGKRLDRLVKQPRLWSLQALENKSSLSEFTNTLPPPSSSQWAKQWETAADHHKEELAKLWLTQLFAYAATSSKNLYLSNVVRQWRANVELAREMYQYWDDAFLTSIPDNVVSSVFRAAWLRPGPEQGRWKHLHCAWFGHGEERLRGVIQLGSVTMADMHAEYGQTMLNVAVQLCRSVVNAENNNVMPRLSYIKHLYACGMLGRDPLPQMTALEQAYYGIGRRYNKNMDSEKDVRSFEQCQQLLQYEHVKARLALLSCLAESTVHNGDGEMLNRTEAYRFAAQVATNNKLTMYDTACVIVPEHTQQWRNAQALSMPLTDAVYSIVTPLSSNATLEVPTDMDNFGALGLSL